MVCQSCASENPENLRFFEQSAPPENTLPVVGIKLHAVRAGSAGKGKRRPAAWIAAGGQCGIGDSHAADHLENRGLISKELESAEARGERNRP